MPNISVAVVDRAGNSLGAQNRTVDKLPNECPICGFTIVPQPIAQGFLAIDVLETFHRCANPNCSRSFISIYKVDAEQSAGKLLPWFKYDRSVPVEAKTDSTAPEIAALSPDFSKIQAQAKLAEGYGLDEIAGPGYRKALEFLIKDYAISLTPDTAAQEEIKEIQLGSVIAKFLTGDKLPVVSKRAAWLGNDETHYERRWIGKDLEDLKNLIAAVEHFIAMEILVEGLPTDMPDPVKKP
jgi:hypothetical protein